MPREAITVERFYTEHSGRLDLKLLGGAIGLKRVIREPTVNRPGLALAVVFTEFQFLIPSQGVILGLGRRYAGPDSLGGQATGLRDLLRLNKTVSVDVLASKIDVIEERIRVLDQHHREARRGSTRRACSPGPA